MTVDDLALLWQGEDIRNVQSLLEIEDDVVRAITDLIHDTDTEEAAAATACTKLLDTIDDDAAPDTLRDKLLPYRDEAMERLLDISKNGGKDSARINAASYLLKCCRRNITDSWPPDTTTNKWTLRMAKARSAIGIQL